MTNIYMEHIYKKKKYDLIGYIKYRKFLRQLDKVTPNYDMLVQVRDFLNTLERVYMYSNDIHDKLYSITDSKNITFILQVENGYIRFVMNNDKSTTITVNHNKTKLKSTITFTEDSIIQNEDDIHLLSNIANWLMDAVKELIIKYYNIRR